MDKVLLLSTNDLRIAFKSNESWQEVLKGISVDIFNNEIVGIVGESGSGKTLTALSMIQLLPNKNIRVNGSITYFGQESPIELMAISEQEKAAYRRSNVSMIFQEPMTSLNPVVKCGKQVKEALAISSSKQAKLQQDVIELFRKVDLPDPERIYNSYPHELSGGQLQRVMIALALICKPKLLIADEPTTALDVTVQKTIVNLLKELQNEYGFSVVFISHDLNLVGQIADRIIVMKDGEVAEEGSKHKIFKSPSNPYTKALLASRPTLDKKLKKLPTVEAFLNNEVASIEHYTEAEINSRLRKLTSRDPLLTITGIEKHFIPKNTLFGKKKEVFKAVNNVSFQIYPGETLGLVGESGCGKSTLGKTILKLHTADAGQIIFNSHSITDYTQSAFRTMRKDIQIIFQDPYSSLNSRKRVEEIITEPMMVHGIGKTAKERKNKAVELLERVELKEEHLFRFPHEFSGGQRQRICIARALALHPKLIVCDESVSALDVSVQARVLNLLIELREEFNMSYLFISHDLSVVKFISDRMMVMQHGKIVEMGPAEEIYKHPKTDYTKQLIDAIPKPFTN